MTEHDIALTHDEALELLAFLLASARGCLFDPPGYGTYRLASAAERLSSVWGPRAPRSLHDYLGELTSAVSVHEWDPMGNAPETETFLDRLIADLARAVSEANGANDA